MKLQLRNRSNSREEGNKLNAIGKWLMTVCAAGIISSLCTAMAEGRGKGLVKAAGGLLVALAALSPLFDMSGFDPTAMLEGYESEINRLIDEQERQSVEDMRRLVEESCASYIREKAARLGLTCTADVSAAIDPDGVLRAYAAKVLYTGVPPAEALEEMREIIENDLGVPGMRQTHIIGGNAP